MGHNPRNGLVFVLPLCVWLNCWSTFSQSYLLPSYLPRASGLGPPALALEAFTECFHLSQSTAIVCSSLRDFPARLFSFFINCAPPGSLWSSSSSSFSFWCPGHCYVAVVVLALSQYMSYHLLSTPPNFLTQRLHVDSFSNSSIQTWSCHWIRRVLRRHLLWNTSTPLLLPLLIFRVSHP